MINDPDEYRYEWRIWKKTIPYLLSFNTSQFNWNSELIDDETPIKNDLNAVSLLAQIEPIDVTSVMKANPLIARQILKRD